MVPTSPTTPLVAVDLPESLLDVMEAWEMEHCERLHRSGLRLRALELAVGHGGTDDQVMKRVQKFADFLLEEGATAEVHAINGGAI